MHNFLASISMVDIVMFRMILHQRQHIVSNDTSRRESKRFNNPHNPFKRTQEKIKIGYDGAEMSLSNNQLAVSIEC